MGLSRFIASALFLIALFPTVALACSPALGVDHDAFYRAIALPGRTASAISILAAIVWLVVSRSPKSRRGVILIALAALNPGWWIWGMGDCGVTAFVIGGLFALLSLVMLGKGLWNHWLLRGANGRAPGV